MNNTIKLLTEPDVTNFICNNIDDIMSAHTSFNGPYVLIKEFRLSNGIKADIAVLDYSKTKILALIESKPEKLGIHAFMTAVGQTSQYQHHIKNELHYISSNSGVSFDDNCIVFIATGVNAVTDIDCSKIKTDHGVKLLLIDSSTATTSSYDLNNPKDISRLSSRYSGGINFISICPYYFRDNRLSELYLALKICYLCGFESRLGKLDRKKQLESLFISASPINPGNARNLFITLSKLGFIDIENRLTPTGYYLMNLSYSQFVEEMSFNYFYPYISNIMNALITFASKSGDSLDAINITNEELKQEINENQGGFTVQFLTDSGTRYISHWLNVLRDDLGAISFQSNKVKRPIKVNYIPLKGLPFKINDLEESDYGRKYSFLFKWLNDNNLPGAF